MKDKYRSQLAAVDQLAAERGGARRRKDSKSLISSSPNTAPQPSQGPSGQAKTQGRRLSAPPASLPLLLLLLLLLLSRRLSRSCTAK